MKKPQPVTKTLVAHLKREAKRRSRIDRRQHSHHLDVLAAEHGYPDWAHLIGHLAPPADKSPARVRAALALKDAREDAALDFSVPIDPALPSNFDETANQDRSDAELKAWWNRPFANTYPDGKLLVRCLDGGAWDRTTYYGLADTHEEARALAREKLLWWISVGRKERFYTDEDHQTWLARLPHHPHDRIVLIERVPRGPVADEPGVKAVALPRGPSDT